jgi:hypothetical protein
VKRAVLLSLAMLSLIALVVIFIPR